MGRERRRNWLDSCVFIVRKEVEVYPEGVTKPLVGEELNKAAYVSILLCMKGFCQCIMLSWLFCVYWWGCESGDEDNGSEILKRREENGGCLAYFIQMFWYCDETEGNWYLLEHIPLLQDWCASKVRKETRMKVQMNEKSKEKDIKVQRVKPLTQTQANEQQMRGKRKF